MLLSQLLFLEKTMTLWTQWWATIWQLRPAFSRVRSFMWFAVAVAGLTVRTDLLGVTSIVRALGLKARFYGHLLESFHSRAVKLDALTALWTRLVLRLFSQPFKVNGRYVLIGDGLKAPKCGQKMPGVKRLHQQSDSNTKPEYIMGHSLQAVSLLVQVANCFLAVPLAMRIHEGIVWSNRDARTLLDKMLILLGLIDLQATFYFVADAYYASGKIIKGLLAQNNHLVTRVKSNAVAYAPVRPKKKPTRGRPKLYGPKVKIKTLFKDPQTMQCAASPVYGEKDDVKIQYRCRDLLWRPAGRIVRFVAVIHPTRGRCLLMTTDLTLTAIEVIRLYGLRFKIEHTFKQAVRVVGALSYHFWMQEMKPLRRKSGDQYMHRETEKYRQAVKRKLNAYHSFIQAGLIAQGLLQYLAACFPKLVWSSFGSWLRTIRPGVVPSELVVKTALRNTLPHFLLDTSTKPILAKFIVDRQNADRMEMFSLAA